MKTSDEIKALVADAFSGSSGGFRPCAFFDEGLELDATFHPVVGALVPGAVALCSPGGVPGIGGFRYS